MISLLHRIYRKIFDKYFKWSDVNFIGYINRKLELRFGKDYDQLDKIDLSFVSKYYRENSYQSNESIKRVVLVDASHPVSRAVFHVNFIQLCLSSIYKTRVIGYSTFAEQGIEKIYHSFGVHEFINIYKLFNPVVVLSALFHTVKSFHSRNHINKFSNLPVMVDGRNIGDHIYDSYLRRELVSSHRKVDLKYLLYVYRGLYYYFSSKKSFSKLGITDIIVNSKVYTNGILIKACASISDKINIWQTEPWSYDRFSLSRTNTKYVNNEIPFDRLYRKYYGDIISKKFTKKDLNTLFDNTFKRGISWVEKKYSSENDVFQNYSFDSSKKNVFIMTHAFNDAVRIANNNIFADYRIWFEETLLTLSKNNNINIFVKPHPAENNYHYKEKSTIIFERIKSKNSHKNMFIFEHEIEQEKFFEFTDVIITVCGSIGFEAPCFSVPVITAARGSYYDANTTLNPKTYDQYIDLIKNVHNLKRINKNKVIEAKTVYLFTNLFRYHELGISFDSENKDEVERYLRINKFFSNLDEFNSTKIFSLFSDLEANNREELINLEI